MHTSTLIENGTFVELPTTAYWHAGGNNMDSPTMAYKYPLRTGMQKRDDSGTNRGTLQVYLCWAVAMPVWQDYFLIILNYTKHQYIHQQLYD
jgi:hypothetical protein